MLKENLLKNEKIKPNSREIELLRQNFPQFFSKEGEFLLEKFKEMLKMDDVKIDKEGYELKFLGKNYARFLTSIETETVIVPNIKHNEEEINKNSENLYIIGDNLDALKHLLNSYSGKIKCIYIDPPYNTGSDGFVYNDNFGYTAENISEKMGIELEEAQRIIDMRGKSTHSAWLTFMYPRLVLARDLLKEDGAIFISIDDNEQANLKMICDEIFGEENFIEIFSWQKTSTPPNLSKKTKKSVEYILCYQKNECKTLKGLVKESKSTNGLMNQSNSIGTLVFPHESVETSIKNEKLEKGIYGTESYVIELLNDVEIRNGKFLNDIILKGKFKWSQDYLEEQIKLGTKIFIKTKALSPSYEKEEYDPEKPWNIIDRNFGVGTNENASDELDNLFYKNFSDKLYPKPTSLITYLLNMLELENNIILDFFSGSATTAHAVMQLNAEDDGNRKYIMVQLPEKTYKEKLNKKDEIKIVETPAYKAGYKTIDEIGIERIKRAAKKIKEETQAEIDYGFKIVKLETPNSNTLDKIVDFNPDDKKLILDNFIDEFKFGETEGYDTILTTWLNQDGYGMNVKSQKVLLKNFEIDVFENSAYVIKEGISSEDVMELITRVEKNEIAITRLVVYPYSVSFNVLHEMKKNFKNLRGNKELKLIERY
ncbi:DNA (cytosine-5-)-methyltransferase [Leptotrichia wadei]|uniref:DNA (Cytosine-5-)-methyltransferase n=1 Tax=Leptotrichia wadei TaxID=157687 RepID=A0A134AN46_9FUSO|nr:site-specific DNA-methyltransferase [Leptotrichia wadei]KXB69117.1 DNA (cytosine-5-)-methyltransferase [Leptotrichia wadei]